MSPDKKSSRPWQIIAEEVCRETDSTKVADLADELNRALEERAKVTAPCPNKESA